MYYMDVVSVLFFVWFASVPGRQVARLNIWNGCAWFNVLEWCKTYCIYKNVRTRSINVVMAMLWKNAFNKTCWKMFQHNNKYMNVIWLKPWAVRCGGSCIRLIFNHESALDMDQIRRYPPYLSEVFWLSGNGVGSSKKLGHGCVTGGKIWISSFCTVYKEKPWYSVVVKIGKHLLEQTR